LTWAEKVACEAAYRLVLEECCRRLLGTVLMKKGTTASKKAGLPEAVLETGKLTANMTCGYYNSSDCHHNTNKSAFTTIDIHPVED
jgi:hypothetical protein